jgi:N-acetyl-anhydromuramyl-L-alanine amidase AmpD
VKTFCRRSADRFRPLNADPIDSGLLGSTQKTVLVSRRSGQAGNIPYRGGESVNRDRIGAELVGTSS